jgi:hypothetical protein
MKISFLLVLIIIFSSCQKKTNEKLNSKRSFAIANFKDYNFELLNTNYHFNLEKRIFKIDFYKFSDTIKLTENEEKQIAKIFFENYIDTLKNDIVVRDESEPHIVPNFGDSFYIYHKKRKSSFFRIIDGEYKDDNLNDNEKNLLTFRNSLINILKKNPDFKRCLDTLNVARKYDKRMFL